VANALKYFVIST